MSIPVRTFSREDMLKGVARFSELARCRTGLPDMDLPEGERAFLNVLGFDQPDEGSGHTSPFRDAAQAAITQISSGFGLSFLECEAGKGVLMHNHETVETFMCMEGVWRIEWEGDQGNESVEMRPVDFFACPVGVNRRFECVKAADGKNVGLLLGIIEGDAPGAEFSPGSWERIREHQAQQPA